MRNVAYHNRMDLFTMAVILNHLGDPAAVPADGQATAAADEFAAGSTTNAS
jgi:hypothetical protein